MKKTTFKFNLIKYLKFYFINNSGNNRISTVSSSSHLILISKYVDFEYQGLSIDVGLHIGSLLAVITYFTRFS